MSQLKTEAPQRQSQVSEQTNMLERELRQLHEAIDSLPEGLTSVLRQPSSNKESEEKDSTELVVLAITIQGFGDSVRSARRKVVELLDRLEL